MNVPQKAGFFDILIQKGVAVSCNASGRMAMPYPVGARDAVFMRVSRRFFTGLNSPTHEKMTTIITLSQTCGLHPGIQQVTEGQLPRFYERGPIEAMITPCSPLQSVTLPRFYERGPIEA